MSDTPDATEPTDAIESESAADLTPPEPEDAAPGTPAPVDTVTRRGAGIAMVACLLVGGLVGWLGANAVNDDDDQQPVSFQQRFPGGGGRGDGQGHWEFHGPMGDFQGDFNGPMPPGGFPGGPGGFPGGPGEGEGGFDQRGYPPGYEDQGEYDDHGDDQGTDDDQGNDQSDDDSDQGDDNPTTTTESGGN